MCVVLGYYMDPYSHHMGVLEKDQKRSLTAFSQVTPTSAAAAAFQKVPHPLLGPASRYIVMRTLHPVWIFSLKKHN